MKTLFFIIVKFLIITCVGYGVWYAPNSFYLDDGFSRGNYIELWNHFNLYVTLLVISGLLLALFNRVNWIYLISGINLGQLIFLYNFANEGKFTMIGYGVCVLFSVFSLFSFYVTSYIMSMLKPKTKSS
jgi:hypothetical protein